jgi:hypothetical protein
MASEAQFQFSKSAEGFKRVRGLSQFQLRFCAFQSPIMSDGFEQMLHRAIIHRLNHRGIYLSFSKTLARAQSSIGGLLSLSWLLRG